MRWQSWLCTLAVLTTLGAGYIYVVPRLRVLRASALVNETYRRYRPFDYRWRGAPHGAVNRRYLSSGDIHEAMLAVQALGPGVNRVLHARLLLLIDAADEAIGEYRLALYDNGGPEVQAELGMALALRAERQSRAIDFAHAINHLMAARAAGDRSRETLHNLAAILEKFPMPTEAVKHWRELEAMEPAGPWREEARHGREVVEGQLARRNARIARVLNVGEIALEDLPLSGTLERALNEVIETWLPRRWSPAERHSLLVLANALTVRHGDRWLGDLLREVPSLDLLSGLAAAHKANGQGRYGDAWRSSTSTLAEIKPFSVPALKAAVEAERAYSLQRMGRPCEREAASVAAIASRRSYVLLALHARLDEITCRTRGPENDGIAAREDAFERAQHTGFEELSLRALGFLTERHFSVGRPLFTWNRARQGLQSFWGGIAPPLRGHQFYYTLAQAAEAWDLQFTAASLAAEDETLMRGSDNASTYALVISKARYLAARAGLPVPPQETLTAATAHPGFPAEIRSVIQAEQAETDVLTGNPSAALAKLAADPGELSFGPFLRMFREQARGNALLASGDTVRAQLCFRNVIQENERRLNGVRARLQRDAAYREVEASFRGLADIMLRGGKPAEALAVWRAFRSGASLEEHAIRPRAGFLEITFAYLPSGVWAWLTGGGRVQALRLGDKAQVNRIAGQFAEMASNQVTGMTELNRAGNRLMQLFSGTLGPLLRGVEQIVVDAEGPLASVPWPALPIGNRTLLIDRAAVLQAVGSKAGEPLAARPGRRPLAGLIVAEPTLPPALRAEFPPLDDARSEAVQLAKRVPQADLVEGPAATAETVKARILNARLFHFAGHGVANGGFGALLVAGSSDSAASHFLTADELAGLNLANVELVFLAACSAGDGEAGGSLNADNLVRAFLEAGASRVVAVRWTARSALTADLVASFYNRWFAGLPAEEALHRAMLEVKADPRFGHPFFWAGFQVFRRF